MRRLGPLLLAAGVVLIAAAARFYQIDAQSLWNDEGSSYVQATRSFAQIADHAARDIHPPGYYWLLRIWTGLVGTSEFGLRSLSAFAGVLTVAFTYALGLRLFGRIPGLLAALFVALNTFSIYYGQEARMYALLAMWGAASMTAFVAFMQTRRPAWGVALALFNLGGLFTQYAFPFVMAAQGIMAVVWLGADFRNRDREAMTRTLRGYVAANLLTIALYAPWLGTAWDQVTSWPNTGDPIPPTEAIADILAYFAFGITVGEGTTLAVAFFLLFALIQLPDERGTRAWWRVLLPPAWVGLTVGAFLALELFREANLKFLLPAQVGFALWTARGVYALWQTEPRTPRTRWITQAAAAAGVLSIVVTLISGLDPLYTDPAYQRDDYRGIVARISENPRATDAVILNAPGQQEVFGYYYGGDATIYPIPRGYGGDDPATLAETRQIIDDHERIFAVLWGTSERDPNAIVETTLDSEAFEADSTWFGDVRFVRYAAPVTFDDTTESGVTFGDSIVLERYAISARTLAPGDVLQLQFQWRTDTPLEIRYKLFVQLLDANGVLVAQRDAEPVGGLQPTTAWVPGETVIDNHALIIPQDLPPAHYSLIIGFYNRDDPSARLPVEDSDNLSLGRITIE